MSRPKGTGCIYQRPDSSVWWIKYSRNGKDFRESTHTDNKRKAERILKQRVAELVTGTFSGLHVERVRVDELADDFVITREDGKPVRDFRDTWAKVCKDADSPGLLFHDLRRTAARNLRRAGVAENVIMQIGGWRTRSVFDRYAIITENDIVDAVRKLEADRKQREALVAEVANSHESVTKSTQDTTRVANEKLLN